MPVNISILLLHIESKPTHSVYLWNSQAHAHSINFHFTCAVEGTEAAADRRPSLLEQLSEKELVEALTDNAHKIASNILAQPGTGQHLGDDVQVKL